MILLNGNNYSQNPDTLENDIWLGKIQELSFYKNI